MKRKLNTSVRVAATPSVESIDDSAHITRGDARREAANIREYRDRLQEERRIYETSLRDAPPAPSDE
jgi:hypothetical protein